MSTVLQGFTKSLAMTFVSEIGDKTFFAAVILAMLYPRRLVLAGCLSALVVMTILSATVGWAAPNLISRKWTHHITTLLFFGFGLWSLWDGFKEGGGSSEELAEIEAELDSDFKANGKTTKDSSKTEDENKKQKRPFLTQFFSPIFLKAFLINFFGEFGDKSQLATIGLAADENPLGVVLGGVLAQCLCTTAAVIGGKSLTSQISERIVALSGGMLFIIFGIQSFLMDSSFFLLMICAAAIGFFTILGTLLFFVYKKSRSDTQDEPTASSSSSPASSPPSSSSPNWKHQVFVSSTGKDVSESFLSHIRMEFSRKRIELYTDNEIQNSNSIESNLREAIRGSRIAIVMLSRNYASSLWCLSELVEIMECRRELSQQVVPIFYELDPIEVRTQTGEFGEVFKKTCDGESKEDIGRWSQALEKVATIAGYHSRDWEDEDDMVENIASGISNFLKKSTLEHAVVSIYCADTLQYSFASHLSVDFRRKHIAAFGNCNRNVDEMEGDTASVVVLSKNYLSSASCLDMLVRVLQGRRKTGRLVVPVFYGISPSDVVVQEYGSASRIREWNSALQELRELPGHQSREESSECQVVEEIVRDVCETLFPTEQIGINSRLLEIEQLLCKQPWGIRRIGIWGMPGIGKTTLAKAVFDQISARYEASCFIKNFDKAFHEKGLHRLLEEHFGEILKELPRVCSSITRPSLPGDKLSKKRALVVLDDVHDPLVAESFLGGFHWFGPGSLIIITSRDKQVFRLCQINHVYEVQSLNEDESLQLFSQCAFGDDTREHNLQLSMEVIDYTNGNPLALSFYGRELKGKKLSEMETTFLKLRLPTPYKIHYLFKSSYETLNDNEKNIFLDIACFFQEEDVDYVMQLHEGCGFFPHVGIDVLVEKCLVTLSENRVKMHRIIQDFGRDIINGETIQIERRRRLWEPWTIKFLLEDDKLEANGYPEATCKRALGTDDIEGIFLDISNLLFDVKPTAFDDMLNLRFLKIYCSNHENPYGLRLPRGLDSLPYELRLLHWENYPLQSLPQDFDPCHLVEINMSYSQLHKLWGGTKNLEMLKMLKLCHSQQLTEIDDLCKAPNIELIDLQGCTKLQRFPATGQLKHLRVVNLSGCTEITNFPEVSPNIEELHLQGTGIRELPISIVNHLSQKDKLNQEFSNLLTESSGVANALYLEKLTGLVQVVSSYQHLDKLVFLNMKDCYHLQSLPHMVDLESLEVLDLSGCWELKSIQGFPRNLKELHLVGTAVKELPPLPSSIELLNAHGCVSLISIPFGFERLPRYYTFSNCISLSAQVVSKFVKNALTNVERIARDNQPELNKSLAFSFAVPSPASKSFTCDLQPGSSVMIQVGSSRRSTLGFAILVELSFLEGFHEASGFSIICVCRWKDKELISHSLEKSFYCWTPGEGVPKDHMFVFGDLNMHLSTCEGNDPSMLADLVVFEFFTVNKQRKLLDESCTVTKCGVHVITAANGDASSNMTLPFSSSDYLQESFDYEDEEVLRIIYDGLDEYDRNLFLYIACLFDDNETAFLAPLRASIGLEISSRLKFLAKKSLIHITPYGITVRHGLLQNPASTNQHSYGTEFSSYSSYTATSSSSVERRSQFSEAASVSSSGIMSNSGLLLESPSLRVNSFLDLKTETKNFKPDLMLGQGFGLLQKLGRKMRSSKNPENPALVMPFKEPIKRRNMDNQTYYVLGHKTQNIRDLYTLSRKLGKGQNATYLCTEVATGVDYACKSISKRKMISKKDVEDVRREIQIMHHLAGHGNIVTIKGAYEDSLYVHIVMELCAGGELFDRIIQRGHYRERKAAELTKIIVGVVEACHSLGVMHRDLKPENFLLVNKDDDLSLKAIDFGLSVFFKPGQIFTDVVGSPYNVAPEVLLKRYGPEADVWSAGVILYMLLSGAPPFWAETQQGIFDAVLKGYIDFGSDPWPGISDSAKDLIRRMLSSKPAERLTVHEVLRHPWICVNSVAPDRALDPAVVSRLKQFSAMNKLKKMALRIIAESLAEEEIAGLREIFQAMDTDNSGAITFDELKAGLRKYGSTLKDTEIHDLMDAADVDNNGTIDYGEFIAATIHLSKLEQEEHLVAAFQYFDKDGSGYITIDELLQACVEHGMTDVFLEDIIKEIDQNNDGQIDYSEFVAMMQEGNAGVGRRTMRNTLNISMIDA